MKRIVLLSWVLFVFLASAAWGQKTPASPQAPPPQAEPVIHGIGTAKSLPMFTGPTTIGNSAILQLNGNIGIGTTDPIFPLHVFSNNTVPPPGQSSPVTMFVETTGTLPAGSPPVIGVEGLASDVAGFNVGVDGTSFGADGVGVLGNHPGSEGGGAGVVGQTNSTTGFTVGVTGTANGTSGPGVGVFGQTFSPDGYAAYFANRASGNILAGVVSQYPDIPVFRVDGTGKVFANGYETGGADFAEWFDIRGERALYEPGDLLVIDPTGERRLAKAQNPYSTLVAGIYSTKPGVVASTHKMDDPDLAKEVPMAVVGVVPCRVTAENGPINVGDLLVSSSSPGHAMKGTDRDRMLGAVVGKALESLREGKGMIQVLVTLQ
jgi:hypothetical protein